MHKEDIYLYPFLKERTTESEQDSIVGLMAKSVPQDKFSTLIQWLFPLLDLEDQVVTTKVWIALIPPRVFNNLKPLIKNAVAENWVEITRRIPILKDK